MPRRKLIETAELIALVDQYQVEFPDEKIKISKLGQFIRGKGYPVEDYLIRRNQEAVQYIESKNIQSPETMFQTVSVYRSLDVDSFLNKNCSQTLLRKALIERDRYYSNIAASAAVCFKKYQEMKEQYENLVQKCLALEEKNDALQQKQQKKADRQAEKTIKTLQGILRTNVYPEIANELLRRDGLVDFPGNRVMSDAVADETIDARTEVHDKFRDIAAKLMEGFNV